METITSAAFRQFIESRKKKNVTKKSSQTTQTTPKKNVTPMQGVGPWNEGKELTPDRQKDTGTEVPENSLFHTEPTVIVTRQNKRPREKFEEPAGSTPKGSEKTIATEGANPLDSGANDLGGAQGDAPPIMNPVIDEKLLEFIRYLLVGPPWIGPNAALGQALPHFRQMIMGIGGLRTDYFATAVSENTWRQRAVESSSSFKKIKGEMEELAALHKKAVADSSKFQLLNCSLVREKAELHAKVVDLETAQKQAGSRIAELEGAVKALEISNEAAVLKLKETEEALRRAKEEGEGLNLYELLDTPIGVPVMEALHNMVCSQMQELVSQKYPELDLSFLAPAKIPKEEEE